MSFLLGNCTRLPCHSELCIVKASIVTVRCFVCTCEKHFPPELYLKGRQISVSLKILMRIYTTGQDSLEEFIEHDFVDLTRSRAVQLRHLIRLRHVTVEGAELAARIPEEYEKVFGLRACDLLEHFLFGFTVNGAGKNAVLNGI